MTLIKLTNNSETKNNTKWKIGNTVSIDPDKRRPELCTNGVLHAYESIEQALLMCPLHVTYDDNIVIYECDGDIVVSDNTKVGCYELTPIRRRKLPKWYAGKDMRKRIQVQFAILCAKSVDIAARAADIAARAADDACACIAADVAARAADVSININKLAKQAVKMVKEVGK